MQQTKFPEQFQTKKETKKMSNKQIMKLSEAIKGKTQSLEIKPIIKDGYEDSDECPRVQPEVLIYWFKWLYDSRDAFLFEDGYGIESRLDLRGVRVLESKEFCNQTEDGDAEFCKEVFLMADGDLMKFYTFRKSYFCSNCKQTHSLIHRMIAKDQTLSDVELDAIANNISTHDFGKSTHQFPTKNENRKLQLSAAQSRVIKEATKLFLPPILEDGAELNGLYDEKAYSPREDGEPRWQDLELLLTDAGVYFPHCGMRVLYTPKSCIKTSLGNAEISTEVFLTNEGKFVKFLTFRDTVVFEDQDTYTTLHRTIAKDKTLSQEELDSILANISIYMSNAS